VGKMSFSMCDVCCSVQSCNVYFCDQCDPGKLCLILLGNLDGTFKTKSQNEMNHVFVELLQG